MAKKLYDEYNIAAIAAAIRSKNGSTTTYKASEMAAAVEAIPQGGVTPSGTVSITANGSVDVTNYATASVNVPQGITPSGTVSITENGTVDVTNYASAEVVVPQGIEPSGTISITANGSYTVREYESATVNVPSGGITPSGSVSITENGTVDVTQYASAVVNVPSAGKTVVRSGTVTYSAYSTGLQTVTGATTDGLDTSKNYYLHIWATEDTLATILSSTSGGLIDCVSNIPLAWATRLGGTLTAAAYQRLYMRSSASGNPITLAHASSCKWNQVKYAQAGTYNWEICEL